MVAGTVARAEALRWMAMAPVTRRNLHNVCEVVRVALFTRKVGQVGLRAERVGYRIRTGAR